MSTIVIYKSATGFTEQYARWIAEALGCPCKPLKETSAGELAGYNRVIFGGWVMGNGIVGLEKLRGLAAPFAVFAVGCTPAYEEVIATVQEQNKLGDTPLFYMVGGFRFKKLSLPKRVLLKVLRNAVSKKENRSRQEDVMLQTLGTSFDASGREQITPLVEYCE